MKRTKIIYWIVTGLFAAFMMFSAIPDVISSPEAITMFTGLGMPLYLLPFLGVAKILGSIAILVPRFPRLKEWAYAGLFFDLVGAMYAVISLGAPFANWSFFIIFIAVEFASYFLYHKVQAAKLKQV